MSTESTDLPWVVPAPFLQDRIFVAVYRSVRARHLQTCIQSKNGVARRQQEAAESMPERAAPEDDSIEADGVKGKKDKKAKKEKKDKKKRKEREAAGEVDDEDDDMLSVRSGKSGKKEKKDKKLKKAKEDS